MSDVIICTIGFFKLPKPKNSLRSWQEFVVMLDDEMHHVPPAKRVY